MILWFTSFIPLFTRLTGLGGGILVFPLLSFFYPIDKAAILSLETTFFSTFFNSLFQIKKVSFKEVVYLSVPTLITSALILRLKPIPNWIPFLLFLAVASFVLRNIWSKRPAKLNLFFSGTIVGFLSPLIGIGGGIFFVPTLLSRIPTAHALATSSFVVAFTAILLLIQKMLEPSTNFLFSEFTQIGLATLFGSIALLPFSKLFQSKKLNSPRKWILTLVLVFNQILILSKLIKTFV